MVKRREKGETLRKGVKDRKKEGEGVANRWGMNRKKEQKFVKRREKGATDCEKGEKE